MPLLLLPLILLGVLCLCLVLVPFSLVQRYRMGKSRRLLRPWLARLNLWSLGISLFLLIITALFTTWWVPDTLLHAIAGVLTGAFLGWLGLRWTRWENHPDGVFFTPSRWLVLSITLIVAGRILFGLVHLWKVWHGGEEPAKAAIYATNSMSVAGLVLGYYAAYWMGIWRKSRLTWPIPPSR